MANAAVTIDGLQALQVALELTAQIAFDEGAAFADCMDDRTELLGCELFRTDVRIDIGLLEHALRGLRPNTVNVRQRRFNALVAGNVNSK